MLFILTFNQVVPGSSPGCLTSMKRLKALIYKALSLFLILPADVLPDWRDFIKEHGTKRFVEYTDESERRYAELAASGIYED